ncbi:hypothetical protein ECC02_000658 [Trypanosoma cruzi]|uniref:Uncharacterized protein n=1 Tax=Trypanosoma cruzi TaxID=5693 RepID=A0A7J6YHA8_TRYCR|nr:hypothetical protein ECC02_000658 [Trypanosoma cruzi]
MATSRTYTDVEQQLRAWQRKQEKKVVVSCMDWQNIESNLPLLIPIIGITLVTCFVFMLIPFIGRMKSGKQNPGLACRYSANLGSSRALLFASRFNAPLFSAFLTIWLLLCLANVVFYLMQVAANDPTWAERVLTTPDGFLEPMVLLYIVQYWGISSLLIHVIFTSHHYMVGCMASFLPFLVSFYQATRLQGDEVDDWPVIAIKVALLFSFFATVAFTVPWMQNEYRIAMREIDAHTSRALGLRRKTEKMPERKK